MNKFLSCDWGTSTFRLRLIEAESLTVIEEENSKEGIAETYRLWKQTQKNEDERLSFYLDIILKHIEAIEEKSNNSLNNVPIIISGMASSTIGMVDLPYKNLPFATSGEDLEIFITDASEYVKHTIAIISGVRSEDDVIRGEETKIIGCAVEGNNNEHVYILPGTHPKHIEVKNGQVIGFKTYMTGEFFELLSNKSILAVSVKKGKTLQSEQNIQSFSEGVKESLHSNLLHSSFLVRTNELFKKYSLEENYFYLSGLLIGNELKDITGETRNITIVGNAALNNQYIDALHILGLPGEGAAIASINADAALIKGQNKVYKKVIGI